MRIATIDHSYHRVTKSTEFFYEILSTIGSVRRFHDDSWCGGSNDWRSSFDESDYDLIVIWQSHEAFSALSGKHDNVLFVPMYDAMLKGSCINNFYWKSKFSKVKCLSFCRKLHQEITKRNGISWYSKYFPDPADYDVISDFSDIRPFFWYRRSEIDTKIVFELCANTEIKNFMIHNAPDPGQARLSISDFPRNISNCDITTWFEKPGDYQEALLKSNVFFVPRPVEGIGMAFLEAMASGLCVVAPDLPTMNEYIANGTNGMLYSFEQKVPLRFARAREIGARARETVERGFADWQRELPDLIDFIVSPKSRLKTKRSARVHWVVEPAGQLPSKVKVSVVTICLDASEHLESTIQSVLGQDLPDFEYIILDGASKDGSVDIIKKYAARLAHWQSEPDQGAYHAMNKALDHCAGEWVLFMNAGDTFSDWHSLSRMFREAPKDADIVYGHHFYVPVGGTAEYHAAADFETTWDRLQRGELWLDWLAGIPSHQATAVRHSLLQKLRFDTTFRIAADHDLLFRARKEGARFFNCDEIISIYAGGGMSAKNYPLCKQEWARLGRNHGDAAAVDRFYFLLDQADRRAHANLWQNLLRWVKHKRSRTS
ncbi:glycosyltransferase [Methylovirgula sp. HY1]|uniref:glycosyltransferase n=1 Tax=Methylovirgula sp. HY1 TaxID=2822761 RepID=UPI001C5B4C8F|nr:glycosyltransferase [Methylovirgula sp. HY1]QXX76683.1 putative glycosyltransferase [Methylovirgula sp. HY1]